MSKEITKELTEQLNKYYTNHNGELTVRHIEVTCKPRMCDTYYYIIRITANNGIVFTYQKEHTNPVIKDIFTEITLGYHYYLKGFVLGARSERVKIKNKENTSKGVD